MEIPVCSQPGCPHPALRGKYCSEGCMVDAAIARDNARSAATKPQTPRKVYRRQCDVCKVWFESPSFGAKYCGDPHKKEGLLKALAVKRQKREVAKAKRKAGVAT